MASVVMQQQQQLHNAPLYTPIKVGNVWKFKAPYGVETCKTKKAAIFYARKWKEVEN